MQNELLNRIKKKDMKKNSFQEISKDFIKNDFQLMISFNFICVQFSSYLHLLYQKNLLLNFNLDTKIIFTCLY